MKFIGKIQKLKRTKVEREKISIGKKSETENQISLLVEHSIIVGESMA